MGMELDAHQTIGIRGEVLKECSLSKPTLNILGEVSNKLVVD